MKRQNRYAEVPRTESMDCPKVKPVKRFVADKSKLLREETSKAEAGITVELLSICAKINGELKVIEEECLDLFDVFRFSIPILREFSYKRLKIGSHMKILRSIELIDSIFYQRKQKLKVRREGEE